MCVDVDVIGSYVSGHFIGKKTDEKYLSYAFASTCVVLGTMNLVKAFRVVR